MDTHYAIDGEANQRLIENEDRRRRILVDRAIQSYAPTLAGKPDVHAIYLYSSNSSLRKLVREMAGARVVVVEHCLAEKERKNVNAVQQEGMYITLPDTADLVVTKSALNSKVEWLAARLKALPCVLPEATDYCMARLRKVGALVLVGGDQA